MSMKVYHGTYDSVRAFVAAGSRSEAVRLGMDLTASVTPPSAREISLVVSWPRHVYRNPATGIYERVAAIARVGGGDA